MSQNQNLPMCQNRFCNCGFLRSAQAFFLNRNTVEMYYCLVPRLLSLYCCTVWKQVSVFMTTALKPQINKCNSPRLVSAANVNGCAVTARLRLTSPAVAFHFYLFFFLRRALRVAEERLSPVLHECGRMSDLLTQNIHPSKSSSSSQQAASVCAMMPTRCGVLPC